MTIFERIDATTKRFGTGEISLDEMWRQISVLLAPEPEIKREEPFFLIFEKFGLVGSPALKTYLA